MIYKLDHRFGIIYNIRVSQDDERHQNIDELRRLASDRFKRRRVAKETTLTDHKAALVWIKSHPVGRIEVDYRLSAGSLVFLVDLLSEENLEIVNVALNGLNMNHARVDHDETETHALHKYRVTLPDGSVYERTNNVRTTAVQSAEPKNEYEQDIKGWGSRTRWLAVTSLILITISLALGAKFTSGVTSDVFVAAAAIFALLAGWGVVSSVLISRVEQITRRK